MSGARIPPFVGSAPASEFTGWSGGSQDSAAAAPPDISLGTRTLHRTRGLKLQKSPLQSALGAARGSLILSKDSGMLKGLEHCLGSQVVADLAALGTSSPASLRMLFRTLKIFIYYILGATTPNLHFCDSRRTRGSLETLWGCYWGCGIWC